jgi:hypothetical protein
MRSIGDPVKAFQHMAELFSVRKFSACCSLSVPELERVRVKEKRTADEAGERIIQEVPGQSALPRSAMRAEPENHLLRARLGRIGLIHNGYALRDTLFS